MVKGIGLIATALLLCAIIAPATWADTLTGQSGTVSFDSPSLGAVYDGPYSFTVPAAVAVAGGRIQNSIGATTIDITFTTYNNAVCSSCSFIGEVFNFPGFTISGVSGSESFPAVVTFDANDIYVNFLGYDVSPSDYVDITVTGTVTPPPMPEPSSFGQLVLGILALGVVGFFSRALIMRNSSLA